MKTYIKTLVLSTVISTSTVMASTVVTGAGSTFIYPVLARWAHTYQDKTGKQINYQPIGSGGGIKQLQEGTVDFAASDMPLKSTQLQDKHWQQFPMITGGIVPIVNVKHIKNNQLILDGQVLADIYLGKITKWNDPKIKKLNPKLTLPDTSIVTVHRADGSGTTFNFTNYLSTVSPTWNKKVHFNTVVEWPGSSSLGARGNAGVASQIKMIPNSIGYVEYAYALQNGLVSAKMKNKAGQVVTANSPSFVSAAKYANWQAKNHFYQILTSQPGDNSWPIVATTFVLIPDRDSKATRQAALDFFRWSYRHGGKMAKQLDYVPIPKNVYQKIEKSWVS